MECAVCLNAFDQQDYRPLCLPCGHSICSNCVSDLAAATDPFFCPTCRLSIPSVDGRSLPTNFSLLEKSQCQPEEPKDKPKDERSKCVQHPEKTVKFHCEDCKQDFCSKCVLRHTGSDHHIEDISLAIDHKLDHLLLQVAQLDSDHPRPLDFLIKLERRAEELVAVRTRVENAYEDAIAGVIKEKDDTIATLKSAEEQNRANIDRVKEENKKQTSALSEARELLRVSRHSLINPSEKRANIDKAKALIAKVEAKPEEQHLPQCELRMFTVKRIGFGEDKWVDVEETVEKGKKKEEEIKEEVKEEIKEEVKPVKIDASLPRTQAKSLTDRDAGKKRKEPSWWYMSDSSSWSPYILSLNHKIEAAFQRKEPSIDLGKYIVDFTTMMQTNKATRKQRKIGREIAPLSTFTH